MQILYMPAGDFNEFLFNVSFNSKPVAFLKGVKDCFRITKPSWLQKVDVGKNMQKISVKRFLGNFVNCSKACKNIGKFLTARID